MILKDSIKTKKINRLENIEKLLASIDNKLSETRSETRYIPISVDDYDYRKWAPENRRK